MSHEKVFSRSVCLSVYGMKPVNFYFDRRSHYKDYLVLSFPVNITVKPSADHVLAPSSRGMVIYCQCPLRQLSVIFIQFFLLVAPRWSSALQSELNDFPVLIEEHPPV